MRSGRFIRSACIFDGLIDFDAVTDDDGAVGDEAVDRPKAINGK
jgi:hypothetical protein